jgi:hypothetical protein
LLKLKLFAEIVKFQIISVTLMNSNNRIGQSNNRTKAIAVETLMGSIVTAVLLLSGLSLISSHQQPVLAQQQNMTAANATAANATAANATAANATAANATATTTGNQTAAGNQTATTAGGATNATTAGGTTTPGGPMAGQGEGSGGGAAGAGGTAPSQ